MRIIDKCNDMNILTCDNAEATTMPPARLMIQYLLIPADMMT